MDPLKKARIATVWLGGCSGCHMSFLDMDERLLELAGLIELCYSPLVDTKEFPEVDVTLVEGAVAADEHLEMIHRIRARTKVLVSFGDCAVTGNLTAMRNVFPLEDVVNRAYRQNSDIVNGIPGGGILPMLLERVRPLHQVVPIDHFLPGCPPPAEAIYTLLRHLILGEPLPPVGKFG
ncbi:MAG: NADP oxidoreductase [Bryobacteraceae bacterium]|nr:NADP oxidoreductase [Bryobacteraceae bacterium]